LGKRDELPERKAETLILGARGVNALSVKEEGEETFSKQNIYSMMLADL
jgi:hypothetical protein